MILVDSSVWIDLLANRETPETRRFEQMTAAQMQVGVGDLMLAEVLQGVADERNHHMVIARFAPFPPVRIADHVIAEQGARNHRYLRSLGITVRKTIDTLIATRCIVDDSPLLYTDRGFDPFVEHLGLRSAIAPLE